MTNASASANLSSRVLRVALPTQIELYEGLYKEIDIIPTEKVFNKWFRVNVKPFKQALLNTVCKWSSMIKQHLVDHVINRYSLAQGCVRQTCSTVGVEEEAGLHRAPPSFSLAACAGWPSSTRRPSAS